MRARLTSVMVFALLIPAAALAQSGAPQLAGRITHVDGPSGLDGARVSSGPSSVRPATIDGSIYAGEHVVTGGQTSVGLKLNDESEINIGTSTDFSVNEAFTPQNQSTVIDILYGLVHTAVNREYSAEHPFLVQTPNSVMGVRGTEFLSEHDASTGQSTVHTLEGSVAVASNRASFSNPAASQVVGAGTMSSMARGQTAPKPAAPFDRQALMQRVAQRSPTFAQRVQATHANHMQMQQQRQQQKQQKQQAQQQHAQQQHASQQKPQPGQAPGHRSPTPHAKRPQRATRRQAH